MASLACACSAAQPSGTHSAGTASGSASAASPGGTLSRCPAARALSTISPLARIPGDDDDLVTTPSGDLWVSRPQSGEVIEVSPAGAVLRRFTDPNEPEGLAVTSGGRLFLAEQRTNRVMLLDPNTGSRTPVVSVAGARGLDVGIDGIGVDPSTQRLLIPDGPEGTLLTASEQGGALTVVARGLGRPVAATAFGGAVLVGEENPPGLVRVTGGGAVSVVAPSGLRSVDDVVVLRGVAYVSDLAAAAVEAVDPATGAVRTLLTGAPSPQGLTATSAGRLVLADSGAGELVQLEPCG